MNKKKHISRESEFSKMQARQLFKQLSDVTERLALGECYPQPLLIFYHQKVTCT